MPEQVEFLTGSDLVLQGQLEVLFEPLHIKQMLQKQHFHIIVSNYVFAAGFNIWRSNASPHRRLCQECDVDYQVSCRSRVQKLAFVSQWKRIYWSKLSFPWRCIDVVRVQIINGTEMQRALNLVLSVFYWKTFKTFNNFFGFFLCLGGKSVPLKT